MSVATVAVIVKLLASLYAVDPVLMDCVVYRESGFDTNAVNGGHTGLAQFRPETLEWMGGKAKADPRFLHGYMEPSANDPVYSVALLAWGLKNNLGQHWSTWAMCGGAP